MAFPEQLHETEHWQTYLEEVRQRPEWEAYPDEFFERLGKLRGRSRITAWTIIEEGSVSTLALHDLGYSHPPRAKQDLKEVGIPVRSTMVRNPRNNRSMASYSFFSADVALTGGKTGRVALPKKFTDRVKREADYQCAVCSGRFDNRGLQADHRIPYAIAGDDPEASLELEDFMALCRSCNRAKSWACEHCPNWELQDPDTCATCYWASPEAYTHVATQEIRRLDLVWRGDETQSFDLLRLLAEQASEPLPDYVKDVLEKYLRRRSE